VKTRGGHFYAGLVGIVSVRPLSTLSVGRLLISSLSVLVRCIGEKVSVVRQMGFWPQSKFGTETSGKG